MWPGDQQTVDGRCARMIPNLNPAWSTFTPITMPAQSWFASDHDQRGASFPDHDQRSTGFFRPRAARRRFFPITTGAAPVFSDHTSRAPVFSDHHWRGASFFRLQQASHGLRSSDYEDGAALFSRSRPARHAFFPITTGPTGAARVLSDHDRRGTRFFRSRLARRRLFPITRR